MLATFTVTNLADSGAGSLRQAIVDANSVNGPDEIVFQSGLPGSIQLSSGELEITDAVTIEGPGANELTIDAGNGADDLPGTGDGFRIFNVDDANNGMAPIEVTLSGLTLTGGDVAGAGGAIRNLEHLMVTHSTISGNSAWDANYGPGGGGIYSDGYLAVTYSTISDNSANGVGPSYFSSGGGIYGAIGSITNVTHSTISGNSASGVGPYEPGGGGGMYVSGTVTVNSSTISGNSGGGMRLFETATVSSSTIKDNSGSGMLMFGTVTVSSSTISGNSDGGIYLFDGTATVSSSTIKDNSGSGIFLFGTVTVSSCTISGNSDGGIYLFDGTATVSSSTIKDNSGSGIFSPISANLTVINSTISGNSSSYSGGGIVKVGGELTVTSSTISGNSADFYGGGIASLRGTTTLSHTIVSGNTAPTGSEIQSLNGSTVVLNDYNLLGDSSKTTNTALVGVTVGAKDITATSDGTQPTALADILHPLADNCGPTQTHALVFGSPAIDAGDPLAMAGMDGVPEFDQRGVPFGRVEDGNGDASVRIDIGTFETLPPADLSITKTASQTQVSEGGQLTYTIVVTNNGPNGFVINGIDPGDSSGWSTSGAGDVNGDGIDDVIIAATTASPDGNSGAGESYVVFGSQSGFPASFDLADLNGANGFVLNGIDPDDRSGYSVSSAGDVNGDVIDDLIIGARLADRRVPSRSDVGESYVVFGTQDGFPASLNLADLNGPNGFVLRGIDRDDQTGVAVSGAGDVNGDGIDDLIIGAFLADPGGNADAGESYVVFGTQDGFPAYFNLADLNGANGFVLSGIDPGDQAGIAVSGAGDVNGDGIDDVIIGAWVADPDGNPSAGESYVVFGSQGGFPASLNLANLNGTNGFVLNGIDPSDESGRGVSSAGDVNGDGIDDLIIGAFLADVGDDSDAGESYVVFGTQDGFPASLDLADLNGSDGLRLNGIDKNDWAGISVSGAGDVNADGIDDLIIGARGGHAGAGESYVVFGSQGGFPASLNLAELNDIVGATVTDTFPPELTDVTWTAVVTRGMGSVAGSGTGNINETIELTNGSEITFTAMGTVVGSLTANQPAARTVTNTAAVACFAQGNRVWLGDGSGGFADSGQSLGNHTSRGVSLGDLDGDGDLDAFVTNFNQANRVWVNDGSGNFIDSGQNLGSHRSTSVSLGDVDDDGDLDAFVANYNQANRVWLNDGSGNFSDSGQSLGDHASESVNLGDVDGDGDLDAFVASLSQADRVWLGDGSGNFADSGQALGDYGSFSVSLGDVDGDGDLDAFVANYNQGNGVWLGDGSGNFTISGQSLGNHEGRSVSLGDVDGDGDLDAFVANRDQANRVWLNTPLAAFTVTNLDDSGVGSLRQAILNANAIPGANDIVFQSGLTGTISLETGELAIADAVTIEGPGANELTIEAGNGADNTPGTGDGFRIFNVDDGNNEIAPVEVTLSGMTLTGGDLPEGSGGAILNREDLTVTHSTISDNAAGGDFLSFGGGIHNDGGTMTITESTISGNSAGGGFGGGVGGGIYNGGIQNGGGTMTIADSTISGNFASYFGGGINSFIDTSLMTITNSSIRDNWAYFRGGGIDFTRGTLTVTDSTISGNSAGLVGGGGIYGYDGTVTVINSTISANSVDDPYGRGGGVLMYGELTVTHSTISGNSAGTLGGGIFNASGTTTLRHTIVSGNTAPTGSEIQSASGATVVLNDYNLLGDSSKATSAALVGVTVGANDITATSDGTQPTALTGILAALADNDGPTETHALVPDSPAIDAGDPLALAGMDGVPEFDQRGLPFGRVEDGNGDTTARIEIGAYEVQPPAGPACDFDSDGLCDIDDLDLFYPELGGTDPIFNLDGIGVVDNNDLTEWLSLASTVDPLGRTFVRGDIDLDGSVLGNDFTLLAANFGDDGGWWHGNFVVDPVPGGGIVAGSDFTLLAANFGFTSPLRANADGTGHDDPSDELDRSSAWLESDTFATEVVDRLPARSAAQSFAFRSSVQVRPGDTHTNRTEARIADQLFEDWMLT